MRNKVAKQLHKLATEETVNEKPVKTKFQMLHGSNIILLSYPERRANYKAKKRNYSNLNRNQRTAFNAS